MGFLGGLGRFLQGKPIFQSSKNNDALQHSSTNENIQANSGVFKNIPTVFIEQSDCHNSGDNMRIDLSIINRSIQQVEIARINLMGTHRDINVDLSPGESRELPVYDGVRPRTCDYKDAYLQFKDESGDYFESRHTVEFKSNQDGTYYISAFRFIGPVKDI